MTIVKRIGEAHLVINIIDLTQDTMILILPGGGYTLLSNRESGPIATKFNMLGYNTAILYYSCNGLDVLEEGKKALFELSKDYKNIFVIGFSAGGHLAGLLGTEKEKYTLKGMILCYPVITLLDYTHEETAHKLLIKNDNLEERKKYSVELRVDKDTVPTFIWTTKDDELVPYENALLLIDSLNKYGIYNESIIYPHGRHGLALADETAVVNHDLTFMDKEIAQWPLKTNEFIKKVIGK